MNNPWQAVMIPTFLCVVGFLGGSMLMYLIDGKQRPECAADKYKADVYQLGYNAGRHDVAKQWYEKCRRDTGGSAAEPEPPGTKILASYCGTSMKEIIGTDNVWPGEFP